MHYVYILQCADGNLYTGFTSRLDLRLGQHWAGKVRSTMDRRPVRPIFFEAYLMRSDAERREEYLKTSAGKKAIKFMLRDYFHRKASRRARLTRWPPPR